jgi:hypothetical protein
MPSSPPRLAIIQIKPCSRGFLYFYNAIFYIHSKIAPRILANPASTPKTILLYTIDLYLRIGFWTSHAAVFPARGCSWIAIYKCI